MSMTRVSNLKAWTALLVVGLLVTLLVLALGACGAAGGAKEQADGRPLPKDPQDLSPGQYHSVKFKPSLSFKVGRAGQQTHRRPPTLCHLCGERGG